ncbi:heme o synthase [Acidocella aminolytica]|uniref:Protoheme IX farnesyltransferase n=1 Tax=Acidocella aminolytica 101 = DSM 11237 TaxID=1120923 RepID=A0A0D6PHT7_9PROT|nr:heme o synthase [Acidocella aminolytica]GAN81217.1 protoheme IX farnesyltransferase [Acidocella aminolytica 101 = DSM 11237]SHE85144.1 protoheme IX farnesyltransferase [Acidocella aminolytica 101 = DSM 11237]
MSSQTTELFHDASLTPSLGAEPGDWLALLKPRVVSLVVFTGAIGLIIAPGHINPLIGAIAIFCIALGAGAAGAINMWYDRDIDAIMRRTTSRPIPAGKIEAAGALGFGVVLSVISVLLLAMATNLCAAAVLAFSIFYYAVIYTIWLKRRTPQNIVIGGGAGAFPAVIGWAAVTGNIGLLPMVLFFIVFFWTPPHFWSLSLYASTDYEKAGVPMLPVVKGARHTRWNVFVYTLILFPLALSPWFMGLTGWVYGATALVLGTVFVYYAWGVLRDRQDAKGVSLTKDQPARACFKFSILYLFLLFAACAVDRLV